MNNNYPLNSLLVFLLGISIIGTAYRIITELSGINITVDFYTVLSIILALTSIAGSILILLLNKWGYWMMVGSRVLLILLMILQFDNLGGQVQYSGLISQAVFSNLGQIAVLSLLMLLKKNGMNAYQVLWFKMPEEDEITEE